MPKDTHASYYHARTIAGGLEIPALKNVVPVMRQRRLRMVANSLDPAIQQTVSKSAHLQKLVRKAKELTDRISKGETVTTSAEANRLSDTRLHESADGRGLVHHSLVPHLNRCVTAGSGLLTGKAYVRAIHTRGNLHHTPARAAKYDKTSDPKCAACEGKASLAHIVQTCWKSKPERITRHNAVLNLVAESLEAKGYETRMEVSVDTPAGKRRPDLIVFKRKVRAVVLDITIVSDREPLADAHRKKVKKYDVLPIREATALLTEVPTSDIEFSSVTLNWCGAMAKQTDEILGNLGLSKAKRELISIRTVEKAYPILCAHRSIAIKRTKQTRRRASFTRTTAS